VYSSAVTARNHLRSAIACLVVGCLLLLVQTGPYYTFAYTLVAPVAPLWLALRALDRGAYRQSLLCAWVGVLGCGLVSALWGVAHGSGLFGLVALLFSAMAGAELRRLCRRDR
jgi:hypothetical protein